MNIEDEEDAVGLELLELLAVDGADAFGAEDLGTQNSDTSLEELPDFGLFVSLDDIRSRDDTSTAAAATTTSVSDAVLPDSPSQIRPASSGGRKRVKDELEYLRQHVQSLEQRLERLRKVPAEHESSSDWHDGADAQQQQQQKLWELVARRQLDAKQKALVENEKLRTLVQRQLRVAQSLSRALRKRPDVSWLDPFPFGAKRPRLDAAESVFEMLSERVDTLFAQVDTVMRDAGLSDVRTGLQDGVVKTDSTGAMFLEAVSCSVVPFGVHVTGAALWKQLSVPSMTVSNGVYHAIDATEHQIRAEFSVTIRLRRAEAVIHERLVGRRIVEAARVVLVWCTLGDPEGSLFGDGCLRIRSSGWTVVEALPTAHDSSTASAAERPTTLLKSVVHMTPEVVARNSESSYRAGVFTDVVLSGFHQNVSMVHQYIENILLSQPDVDT